MGLGRPTLAIKGDSLALFIDGHVEGVVAHHMKNLTVGNRGRVTGEIHASSITVLGQVIGEIRSDGIVSLAKGAYVEGNIFCARVLIEAGARVNGKIDTGELPTRPVTNEPGQAESISFANPGTVAA